MYLAAQCIPGRRLSPYLTLPPSRAGIKVMLRITLSERQLGTKAAAAVIANGPRFIRAWNLGHGIEVIITPRSSIGTRDNTPLAAIPVLNKRLLDIIAGEGVPNSPDIGCRESRHPNQLVDSGVGVRTGNDCPVRPIPVHGQRSYRSIAVEVETHSPDVVRGEGCYPEQLVVLCAFIWAGNDGPLRAIPVLNQRSARRLVNGVIISDGPDIVLTDSFDRTEEVVTRTGGNWTSDDGPPDAVPVFSERLIGATVGIGEGAHGPDITGGGA